MPTDRSSITVAALSGVLVLAAVLMIADAVESATRAMSDPTPARIDALVRQIANKRLLDGQFDDCELTLRELTLIVESISRTVASMYHGRISYPAGDRGEGGDAEIDIHLPAGHEEVLHFPHIAPHHHTRDHGQQEVKAHDAPVIQPMKMSHARR